MDAGRHPRIKLFAYSEVDQVTGFVGNFHATIRKKARYVDETQCNACQECTKVCPVVVPDEYQQGFSSRHAIYMPFAQAVPSSYVINMDNCLGNNPIACGKCQDVCEKKCIDYDMKDEYINIEVGTVIVATGMEVYDPTPLDEFGYTRLPDVITSMEFERLICAGGPTGGHFIRPSDRTRPKRIGFIQCVGSRSSKRGNPYCSNICCMNTVKDTLLLKDHYPDTESTVFYMDIRSFGKGFEDLYMRSKAAGVRYIRGIPGEVRSDGNGGMVVAVENTTTNTLEEYDLDMVVLSVGVEPRKDQKVVQKLLTLSTTSDGFLLESHPKLKPVDAPTQGVFFAGCVESPKDVKDSVTQAGAAAARSSILLNAGKVKIEAITAVLSSKADCNFCGLCARVCPYNAIQPPVKKTSTFPYIVEAACHGCGTCSAECPTDAISMRHFSDRQIMAQIEAILAKDKPDNVVVFACNWCSYAGGDNAGTSRLQYPATSRLIRTMCSGRVDSEFVLHAFKLGAPVVLVSGCHFSDCHYINAVTWTQRRIEKVWDKLEKLGIRPERLQLEWISAAEGQKFARVMKAVEEIRQTVTPEEIEYTMKVLSEEVAEEATA